MDFLKYIDVMIGLAVVMVLLSPLVTAFTHFVMWWSNARSMFLLQSLQRLLLQLEANPAAIIRVERGGAALPGAAVESLGVADADGILWLPNGMADHRRGDGLVPVVVKAAGTPVAGATLKTTLIPQRLREAQQVVSDHTDASGKAKIVYAHAGPEGYSSFEAKLVVRNASRVPIAADVQCLVGGIPTDVSVTTAAPGAFRHPAGPNAPAAYDIECTVTTGGTPLQNVSVEARFERNTRFDRTVVSDATDATGSVSLALGVMTQPLAVTIGKAVAHHPMVARTRMAGPWERIPPFKNEEAEVIEREQLIKILLELASGEGAGAAHLTGQPREALGRLLAANGIANPSEALARVRAAAQTLEEKSPALASHVRHTKAIIEGAKSEFVGKVTHWFDAAMSRATQQYAAKARFCTMIGSAIVAVALQLNSVELLERLSSDSKLRDALVTEAKNEAERIDRLATTTAQPNAGTANTATPNTATPNTTTPNTTTPNTATPNTATPNAGQPASGSHDLERARAKHKEIEQNLALLRRPELAIIPDHFVWQRVPQARLVRNPLWTSPFPESLELIVGGSSYTVRPRWQQDPLTDIQTAIAASGAPVETGIIERDEFVVVHSDEPIDIEIVRGSEKKSDAQRVTNAAPAAPVSATATGDFEVVKDGQIAYAGLTLAAAAARFRDPHDLQKQPIHLVVDDEATNLVKADTPAELKTFTRETFGPTLVALIPKASSRVTVTCRDKDHHPTSACTSEAGAVSLIVIARDASVKNIRLLSNPADPYSTVLAPVTRRPRAWKVRRAALEPVPEKKHALRPFRVPLIQRPTASNNVPVIVHGCNPAHHTIVNVGELREQINLPSCGPPPRPVETAATQAGDTATNKKPAPAIQQVDMPTDLRFTAARHREGELTVTSHRRGPLELRSTVGKPETNMFEPELAYVFDWDPDQRQILGIVLTWALLSLGAPFWFDALKNLLKLRPAPAAIEQQNREERMKDSGAKAKTTT